MGGRSYDASIGRGDTAGSDALGEVRRIVVGALGDRAVDVFLFGSRATGTARRASDVDVGVLPREPLPTGLLATIRERLEESTVPFAVDVVDLSRVDEAFLRRVVEEGMRWSG